jgi:hypothetical protein
MACALKKKVCNHRKAEGKTLIKAMDKRQVNTIDSAGSK